MYVWIYRVPSQYSTIPNIIYQEHQIVLREAGATMAYKPPLRYIERRFGRNFQLLVAAKLMHIWKHTRALSLTLI